MSATTKQSTAALVKEFDHAACLLCGTENPWSLGLTFVPDSNGRVCTVLKADERLQGYAGMLHGGVSAAVLDSAMTHCLFHLGVRGVTADLRVRYVKAVPLNAGVELRAWVTVETPPLYRLKAELTLAGEVLVWAEATFCEITTKEKNATFHAQVKNSSGDPDRDGTSL
jgi:uncharacterized protein (TIGR00369 family)